MNAHPADSSNTAMAEAVRYLHGGTWRLRAACFRLDEAGYRCDELTDLAADAGELWAAWNGRTPPDTTPATPSYIVASAREWRRLHRRSY